MFFFDMHAHGVRGSQTQTDAAMSEDEMEVFGVDWEALRDDNIMDSREENNPIDEEFTSWLGRVGPPQNLNEVSVEPPTGPFSAAEMQVLEDALGHLAGAVTEVDVAALWTQGLAAARHLHRDLF
jgi:hypothetical protein